MSTSENSIVESITRAIETYNNLVDQATNNIYSITTTTGTTVVSTNELVQTGNDTTTIFTAPTTTTITPTTTFPDTINVNIPIPYTAPIQYEYVVSDIGVKTQEQVDQELAYLAQIEKEKRVVEEKEIEFREVLKGKERMLEL